MSSELIAMCGRLNDACTGIDSRAGDLSDSVRRLNQIAEELKSLVGCTELAVGHSVELVAAASRNAGMAMASLAAASGEGKQYVRRVASHGG